MNKPLHTLILLLLLCYSPAMAQSTIVGRIVSATDQQPVPGVNVIVKGSTVGTTTDADGRFSIEATAKDILVFSFIGYAIQERIVGKQTPLDITLKEDIATLDEVTIVSTGYQAFPKERATGSFVQLNQELINRRTSTDILSRLEDVTSGLIFNRNIEGNTNDISIRGRSTINANASPLIVIDNFPYDGDINNINPNDVESITVLRDAAAASIWGARAGNGVIVMTTKKGAVNQPMQVAVNANVTIGAKPDLFYSSRMSTADFIDVEKVLFAKGYYESTETSSNHAPLTPVVERLIANRDGLLSTDALNQELDVLRLQDVRNDYQQYLYQRSANQQYSLSLNGGSATHQYIFSAGMDKNLDNLAGNDFRRVTLNAGNTWRVLKDKLEASAALYYTDSKRTTNNGGLADINFSPSSTLYPYARLQDSHGNTIPLIRDYRADFVEQAEAKGLLHWRYNPLDELEHSDNTLGIKDYRVNTRVKYAITPHLHAEVFYQYWNSTTSGRNYRSTDTYYTRNLINVYTQDDGAGNLIRMLPEGGILDRYEQASWSHNLRTQLNYTKTWRQHELTALGGYEVKAINTDRNAFRYYGYNDELATSQVADYVNYFPYYNDPGYYATIPHVDGVSSLTDRYISYYGNAAYSFKHRYTASVSVRKDQSNLFGVKANQRGVPLGSVGLAWIMSEEAFMRIPFLPYLKLRTTLGYNGTIDKSVTAYTTALNRGYNYATGLPYATIINPPNPELQWERVQIWNTGIDFESKNRIISGSIEYYLKRGVDLIGSSPFSPATGVTSFRGNNANTKSQGIDIVLNTLNTNRAVTWSTTFLLSHLTEKVTTYKVKAPVYSYVTGAGGSTTSTYPLEGRPLYAIYSFDWAGLDPETGDPRGYLDGQPSTDYAAIIGQATTESIRYHGSARPVTFGALRNSFTWKNFALSVNMSYRLGYFFKANSVKYWNVLNGQLTHGDYSQRWQKQGDEAHTQVPSMPETANLNRDDFYLNASVLVEKGDHLRLQDVNLSYTFNREVMARLPVRRVQVYTYVNNLGILWKATAKNVDPDYPNMKPVRTLAAGIKIDF